MKYVRLILIWFPISHIYNVHVNVKATPYTKVVERGLLRGYIKYNLEINSFQIIHLLATELLLLNLLKLFAAAIGNQNNSKVIL